MKKLKYIPGFRRGNIICSIIASIYYGVIILQSLMMLGYGIEYILMMVIMLSIPFIVFGVIDLLTGRYKGDFKKEFILCMIPIFINILCFTSFLGGLTSFFHKEDYLKWIIRNYESDIEEEIKTKKYIESGALLADEISDEELVSIKDENKNLRTIIDGYKEELNSQTYVSDSTSDNNTSSYSSSSNNSNSNNSNSSNYGSSSNSSSSGGNHSHSHNNENSGKHIGKGVYVANGNRYYHAISNCKYLEGAPTSYVTLTASMNKFECNCWTNPVVYKPSSSSSSNSSSGGGKIVYVAKGNSYYHAYAGCRYISGASVSAVGINNVGGKHPCNCVK